MDPREAGHQARSRTGPAADPAWPRRAAVGVSQEAAVRQLLGLAPEDSTTVGSWLHDHDHRAEVVAGIQLELCFALAAVESQGLEPEPARIDDRQHRPSVLARFHVGRDAWAGDLDTGRRPLSARVQDAQVDLPRVPLEPELERLARLRLELEPGKQDDPLRDGRELDGQVERRDGDVAHVEPSPETERGALIE